MFVTSSKTFKSVEPCPDRGRAMPAATRKMAAIRTRTHYKIVFNNDDNTSWSLIKSVSLPPYTYNLPNSHNLINLLNRHFSLEINKSCRNLSDMNPFCMAYCLFCLILSYVVMSNVSLISHNSNEKCLLVCDMISNVLKGSSKSSAPQSDDKIMTK